MQRAQGQVKEPANQAQGLTGAAAYFDGVAVLSFRVYSSTLAS